MSNEHQHSDGWVFYYDGDCGFCTRVVGWLARTDFFGKITWTPFQTLDNPPFDLTWADLDRAAYLDTGRGRLHRGFYAIRMLTLRLLPLLPLAPILWFPGTNLVGVPAYRWIAENRYRISGCRIPGLEADRKQGPPSAGK